MGGDGASGFLSDAYLLDTSKKIINQLSSDVGYKISTWSNQCHMTGPNQITALVQDESWEPFLINYTINDPSVTKV